jgi:hypothetical protein
MKVIFLGAPSGPKTELIHRFTESDAPMTTATIGIDFKVRTIIVDGQHVKMQLVNRIRTVFC